ncbi:MAG TPA: TIR domain-containing protein [Ktedonosporobacter sp.]|nr:TIR domain-containing protein [Ktedonosporobacter sp.]
MDAGMKVEKVDCAIITILPEEFRAVQDRFASKLYKHPTSQHTYGISRVQTKDGQTCVVALARTSGQGNDVSQHLATRMIDDLDPQILLVVGIGGGVPDNDFTLGDVIVSSHIHNFDLSAVKGEQTTFNVTGGVHPHVSEITANLYFYHEQMADWNSEASIKVVRPTLLLAEKDIERFLDKDVDEAWREKVKEVVLWHFGEEQRGQRAPKFLTGPIASSNSLIRSDAILAHWLGTARSIRAVEMEAAGVHQAAQRMRQQYPVMAIRGISDIVGFKRHDDWKQYACHTAAAFAHAFIAAGIIEPREQTPPPPIEQPVQPQPVPPEQESENMLFKKKNTGAIKIFIVFAEEDRRYKERLEKHLAVQVRSGLIELWDKDRFLGGRDSLKEVRKHITSSHIVLLLASSDFTASEECYTQMELAMQQRASGKAVVIPIRVSPYNWPDAPFEGLLALPRDGRPITSRSNPQQDEAWNSVAIDIRKACEAERKKNA